MRRDKYDDVLRVARWIYDKIQVNKADPDPKKCTERFLKAQPGAPYAWASYFTNKYLIFQDIKHAALRGQFEDIKIGYARCESLRREKTENHPGRAAFVKWAIEQIQKDAGILDKESLMTRWDSMPKDAGKALSSKHPSSFF